MCQSYLILRLPAIIGFPKLKVVIFAIISVMTVIDVTVVIGVIVVIGVMVVIDVMVVIGVTDLCEFIISDY